MGFSPDFIVLEVLAPKLRGGEVQGNRGKAGAIQPVVLHRQRVQEMRQRQPHGTDLLPAGHETVEDPTRDDEMRARVIVRERESEAVVMNSRGRAPRADCDSTKAAKGGRPQRALSLHFWW